MKWLSHCAHPGLEPQPAELQQLDSGSQAQLEPLVLWPQAELVPPVPVERAAPVLVEAAPAAAAAADMVGNEHRRAAWAGAAAGRGTAGAELRGGRGGQWERERMELE